MYTQHDEIHRHPNGSIDFDFYRRRAARMRRRAMRRFVKTRFLPAIKPVIAVAAIAAAVYLAPARGGDGWNGPKPDGSRTVAAPDATLAASKF